jgi:hypothetical protein
MHEFHAQRDHPMCNIRNRSIPVGPQLTQLRKLSNENFQGTGVIKLTAAVMLSASIESGSTGNGGAWLKE